MKRILLAGGLVLVVLAFVVFATGASNSSNVTGTYKIELDNAFGLVTGADFKVAGVRAGSITNIALDPGCIQGNPLDCRALVTVQVTQAGFGQFHSDAFCQSRPQSLIGEYFIECQPGHTGSVLKPGSTIPVSHTYATIPADLLADVMRMPQRERFTLIINELGAAAAARSGDLQAALRRAVPALTQTDNLLNLLANDSHTLQDLTSNSDQVITALANNSRQVQRFIEMAGRTASDTATQDTNLQATFQKFPSLLEQLKPAMAKLGDAATTNTPVLANLNAASGQLDRFFTDLPGFSRASLPALRSLGQASVTGKVAVKAATPTVSALNQFAKPAPELGQNLAIVLHDLDDRSRAVEKDTRSPGGQGYTGLEAVLQYVFNQTLAINAYSQFSHLLAVDAFIDPECSPYATPQTIARNLAADQNYRRCYAWLGPNQPGINEPDPSNPGACVPDPGGAPPGEPGPKNVHACKLAANDTTSRNTTTRTAPKSKDVAGKAKSTLTGIAGAGGGSSGGGSSGGGSINIGRTLGQILSVLGGASSSGSSTAASPTTASGSPATSGSPNRTQTLLNYLLAP